MKNLHIKRWCIGLVVIPFCTSILGAQTPRVLSAAEAVSLAQPDPDHKIPYGEDPLQFGYLRLPDGPGPHPVVVMIHGGCWLAQYGVEHVGRLAEALTRDGIATWSIEYRRVGDSGGGWPGTFLDVADGADHLEKIAREYSLDLSRVIAMGHSAGGHLALWLAARSRLPVGSTLFSESPLPLIGVVPLAAVPELESAHENRVCGHVVDKLMGGSPASLGNRYDQAVPARLLPLGVPQILINGAHDRAWFEYGEAYAKKAKAAGDEVRFIVAPEAGHFELILPTTTTWPIVRKAVLSLLDQ
jgi:acetyl esterase/lipase